jgi:hypothetical protein
VTVQQHTRVRSCCHVLAPVRQLSFNSRNARMSFTCAANVHCQTPLGNLFLLATLRLWIHFPSLLCRTKIPYYLMWWIVYGTQELVTGLHQTWGKEWMHAWLIEVVTAFNVYFLFCDFISWQMQYVAGMCCVIFRLLSSRGMFVLFLWSYPRTLSGMSCSSWRWVVHFLPGA